MNVRKIHVTKMLNVPTTLDHLNVNVTQVMLGMDLFVQVLKKPVTSFKKHQNMHVNKFYNEHVIMSHRIAIIVMETRIRLNLIEF